MVVLMPNSDILQELENLMADIGHGLKKKYGLTSAPTRAKSIEWAGKTELYIQRGLKRDEAGRKAAQELFAGYGSQPLSSESDTIEYLLDRVRRGD